MQKLYCDDCSNYLMAGDGECHDCLCGWEQPEDPKEEEPLMDEDQQRVVRDFLAENWADFEAHCEEHGENAQTIYEALGGID